MKKKPTPERVLNREPYWNRMRSIKERSKDHKFPPWVFDFISIHPRTNRVERGYGLCSPMCLVDEETGKRPDWENVSFKDVDKATEVAKSIARAHDLFVVMCP